jgi:hypothetical protein
VWARFQGNVLQIIGLSRDRGLRDWVCLARRPPDLGAFWGWGVDGWDAGFWVPASAGMGRAELDPKRGGDETVGSGSPPSRGWGRGWL